jgi:hypothetical protein
MPRVYANGLYGTTTNDPLALADVTLNSAALADMATISTDDMMITLDPEEVYGAAEYVLVTAHTAAATSATVTRAQLGSSARAHPLGTRWVAGVYDRDLVVKSTAANVPTTGVFDGGLVYVTDSSFPSGATVPQATSRANGEGLYVRDGGRYNPPVNMPWGIMGRWTTTSTIPSIGTVATVITGSTVTWSHTGNRWVRVIGSARLENNALSTQPIAFQLRDDANNILDEKLLSTASNTQVPFDIIWSYAPAAGTRSVFLTTNIGASTMSVLAGNGDPHLLVEDIGPSGAPA